LAVLAVAALIATPTSAAETMVASIPATSAYTTTASLVPGCGGGEVAGGGGSGGGGHIVFRVAFNPDGRMTVNGVEAGAFNPAHTYRVTVHCEQILFQWIATTEVLNETTGVIEFQQQAVEVIGAAEEARAVAQHVGDLSVD
jgi:hypothetical protein